LLQCLEFWIMLPTLFALSLKAVANADSGFAKDLNL
jgi:hypothetical protein